MRQHCRARGGVQAECVGGLSSVLDRVDKGRVLLGVGTAGECWRRSCGHNSHLGARGSHPFTPVLLHIARQGYDKLVVQALILLCVFVCVIPVELRAWRFLFLWKEKTNCVSECMFIVQFYFFEPSWRQKLQLDIFYLDFSKEIWDNRVHRILSFLPSEVCLCLHAEVCFCGRGRSCLFC